MSKTLYVIHDCSTPEGPTGLYFYEFGRGGAIALVFGTKGAMKFDHEHPAMSRCNQLLSETGRKWAVKPL